MLNLKGKNCGHIIYTQVYINNILYIADFRKTVLLEWIYEQYLKM